MSTTAKVKMIVPVEHILRAAKIVSYGAYLIALIATIASYGTQVGLLTSWHVGFFSYFIPATVDILAFCAAIALAIQGLPTYLRVTAAFVLVTAVSVSVTANVMAGLVESKGAAVAHAWPVAAYLLAEMLGAGIRAYAATVRAQNEANNARLNVVQAIADVAPAVPVIVAPVAPTAPTAAVAALSPAVARAHAKNSQVTIGDFKPHTACTHEKTASARAKCRAAAQLASAQAAASI